MSGDRLWLGNVGETLLLKISPPSTTFYTTLFTIRKGIDSEIYYKVRREKIDIFKLGEFVKSA